MSGRLLGNNSSLGLQYVFLEQVSTCQFRFSHSGFWSGNFFLIAPFPDCLPFVKSDNFRQVFVFVVFLVLLQTLIMGTLVDAVQRVPIIYVFQSKNKINSYTHVNPSFTR